MKILLSRHEMALRDELEALGYEALIPSVVKSVRVSRRGNKRIEKEVMVVRGLVFCDIDEGDVGELENCRGVWRRNEQCVELSDDEVRTFIDTVHGERKVGIAGTVKVGEIVWVGGLGLRVKITAIKNNNEIKGVVVSQGGVGWPISVSIDQI